jgi:hypothetical protein
MPENVKIMIGKKRKRKRKKYQMKVSMMYMALKNEEL